MPLINTSTVGMGLLVGKLALAISPKLQRNDYEKDECWPIRCVQKYCSREFLIRSRQNVKDKNMKKNLDHFSIRACLPC